MFEFDCVPDDEHVCTPLLAQARTHAAAWVDLATQLGACQPAMAAWAHENETMTGSGRAAAWAALGGRELPQEALARRMAALAGAGAVEHAAGAAAAAPGSRGAALYFSEAQSADDAILALLAHCGLAAAQLRMTTLACYVAGSAQILNALSLAASAAAAGWAVRCDWVAAILQARVASAVPPLFCLSPQPPDVLLVATSSPQMSPTPPLGTFWQA